jgi:signal transduction histidine kinase
MSMDSSPDSKVNILLVDDREENLVALESVLNDLGQNLIMAQSGREALKQLLVHEFAVILLDVQMPDINGFETAALIRERERSQHTPIVFLTAINKSDFHVTQGYSVGAIDYLFKPIVPEVLKAKVSAFVDLAKKQKELQEEIRQRQVAEEEVRQLNADLERRVSERTAALRTANKDLKSEIAERKQLEKALHQRAEALAEADRRKDEFLAMLAHELRNPLVPIISASSVIEQSEAASESLRRQCDIVSRQSRHLARLVDDLLDVSRITHGKIELRKKQIELGPVIEQAIESSKPLIEDRNHRLWVTVPDQDIFLNADAARVQQIVSNLLNNAVKYTDPGGQIRLIVELAEDNAEVEIHVVDTGVGIAPEMLPRVFDLFAQADRSLDRTQGGLGIGLTMVANLVNLHGGRVEARSEGRSRGSEFIVRLPVLSLKEVEENQAETSLTSKDLLNAFLEARQGDLKVLVIEDNRDASDSLRDMLEIFGHQVELAANGYAGLDAARQFRPNIVLCDIGLPGMDGYEVARRLRKEPELGNMVLVALTGYGQEEDRRKTYEAGFDLHLVKPVDPEKLQGLLETYSPLAGIS